MRSLFPLAAAALALTVGSATHAHEVTYTTQLNGASEFPTNPSAGTGQATVTFDVDLFTMRIQASFSGLTGTTTNAHIHCCTSTSGLGGDAAANLAQNAGVATQTPTFTGFPSGVSAGSYDQTFNMLLLSSYNAAFVTANGGIGNDAERAANSFNALLAGIDAGKAYLNIHSSFRAGGEIRGFLAPVPEPETYALMLAGLGVLCWASRRRQVG